MFCSPAASDRRAATRSRLLVSRSVPCPTNTLATPGTEAEAAAAAQSATAAVFYSVSSTQKGLAGVDLGHFLIEKVCT